MLAQGLSTVYAEGVRARPAYRAADLGPRELHLQPMLPLLIGAELRQASFPLELGYFRAHG